MSLLPSKAQIQRWHYQQEPMPWPCSFSFALASVFYALAQEIRYLAYWAQLKKAKRLNCPVISVGNLTSGGTGKTPITIAIAKYFIAQGKRVLILSRGYGAKKPQNYARASSPDYGDEAYLMQQACPEALVIVGQQRAMNAENAIKDYQTDLVLLDDGFQYLPLHQEFKLLLIDAEKGFGNGKLLPLGPLREPLKAVHRASAIAYTRCLQIPSNSLAADLPSFAVPIERNRLYLLGTQQALDPVDLQDQCLVLLTAIAQPEQFERDLQGMGLSPKERFIFDDHYNFSRQDLIFIFKQIPESSRILITEKDRVKLEALIQSDERKRFAVLAIEAILPQGLTDLLNACLKDFSQ